MWRQRMVLPLLILFISLALAGATALVLGDMRLRSDMEWLDGQAATQGLTKQEDMQLREVTNGA